MKKFYVLLWLAGWLAMLPAQAQAPLAFRVAAVVTNITPCSQSMQMANTRCWPDSIPLAAQHIYTSSGGFSNSVAVVESPLQARVLLLEDAQGKRIALVTLDLLTLPAGFADDVRSQVNSLPGLASLEVLLTASHTHEGPIMVPLQGESPPDAQYTAAVKTKIVTAIQQAIGQLVPASLSITTGESTIAAYRRTDTKLPERDPYPQRLDVLQASDAQGKILAVAYFVGCHPVTLITLGTWISSDFPGASREYVETALHASSPTAKAFFFQGFAGDLNPNGPGGQFESKDTVLKNSIGTQLGREVIATLGNSAAKWDLTGQLGLQRVVRNLSLVSNVPAQVLPVETDEVTVGVANAIGQWTFLFSSHEVVAEQAAHVRSNFTTPAAVTLAGYSNSQFSYLPTRRMIDHDAQNGCGGYPLAYEGCSSFTNYGLAAYPNWYDNDYYVNKGLLADAFNLPTRDPAKWVSHTYLLNGAQYFNSNDVPVAVNSQQQLTINPLANATGLKYGGFASVSTYDFSNKAAAVELVQAPNAGANSEFFLAVERDGKNWLAFNMHDNALWAYVIQDGTMSYSSFATYNATAHRFLRLRSNAATNTVLWEVSANGTSWTTLHSVTPVLNLAAVRLELIGGTYGVSGNNPGTVVLDNFSLNIAGVPDLTTFTDEFSTATPDLAKWNVGTIIATDAVPLYDNTVAVTQPGEQLQIMPISASGLHYNGLSSAATYDLTSRQVSFEVVQAPSASKPLEEFFLFAAQNSANYYALNLHGGGIWAYRTINGSMSYVQIATFDAAAHRFLRLRNEFNYILWEASANGVQWTVLRRIGVEFPLTALHIELVGGTYGMVSAPDPIILDNLNLPTSNYATRHSLATATGAAVAEMTLSSYPNPTTGSTDILYSLPKQTNVSVKIYNALGIEVASVVHEDQAAGKHVAKFDYAPLQSGVYFVQLVTPYGILHRTTLVSK